MERDNAAGTTKPWLGLYPAGVNAEIDLTRYSSLAELIEDTCRTFATRPAFSNMDHPLTFAEIDALSRRFAAFLQSELKLRKGDRIVLQMPNLLQYPIALFGALRAGLVVVNMNPLYTATEMEASFRDSGAVAVVILENFADKLGKILPRTAIRHVVLTEIGDCLPGIRRPLVNFVVRYLKKMVPAHGLKDFTRFRAAMDRGAAGTFSPPALLPEDLAFLQYTGGTTGVSKAAMLTHRNLLANCFQMLEWMKPKLSPGSETVIAALPLYHVFCLTVNCFGLFHLGSHNVLITNPRDIPAFLKTLAKARPTVMSAVSTLVGALLNHPKFGALDLSSMKVTVAGGMALKESVAKEWMARTKTSIIEGYGLTEASPVISCNPLDGRERLGTIGLPLPSTEIRIVDDAGATRPYGEPGELCARGPQVMRGYWNQPAETEKVLSSDGWLRTGDIAVLAGDGFMKIVDRKKDMILVSGFNVFPNEIEEAAMRHPKVLEAAAIGVPDAHSGEAVKLFVVKRDATLTEEEILAFCRENLAGYKRPRTVEFRAELPKTNVGKVLRRELK